MKNGHFGPNWPFFDPLVGGVKFEKWCKLDFVSCGVLGQLTSLASIWIGTRRNNFVIFGLDWTTRIASLSATWIGMDYKLRLYTTWIG